MDHTDHGPDRAEGTSSTGPTGDVVDAVVDQVRQDLAVDWTERGNLEARIRARIKRLLRRHRYTAPQGGGLDEAADRVFRQARALYERWPEIEGESSSTIGR